MVSPKIAFVAASLLFGLGGVAAAHHSGASITRTPARRKKIGTVAGVRGTPFIHLMYVVERRPPSILG